MIYLNYFLIWPLVGLLTGLWLMVMIPDEERYGWVAVLVGCAVLGPIIAVGIIYDELKSLVRGER